MFNPGGLLTDIDGKLPKGIERRYNLRYGLQILMVVPGL
jgi:hypothetical protein